MREATLRAWLLALGLVALTAIGLMAASTAAATEPEVPFWNVAGARLASGSKAASITNVASVKASLRSHIETTEIEIRCASEALHEGALEGAEAKHAGKASGTLELASCKLFLEEGEAFVEDAECTVPTIKSVPLSGSLWLEGKKGEGSTAVVLFEPKESPLAKIAISGCALEGSYGLAGNFAARLIPQNEEFEFIQWLQPETSIANVWRPAGEAGEKTVGLTFEGNAATLQGEVKVELSSHEQLGGGTEPVPGIEAPFWGLGHARLNVQETEELKEEVETPRPPGAAEGPRLSWKLKGTEVETKCSSMTIGNPTIIGSLNQHDGRFTAKSIKLSGCTFYTREKGELIEQTACEVPAFSWKLLTGKLWLQGFRANREEKPVLVLVPEFLTGGKSVLGTIAIKNKGSEKCSFVEENYTLEGGLIAHIGPENAEAKQLKLTISEPAGHVWQSAEQEAEKQFVLAHGSERVFINLPSLPLQPKSGKELGGGSKGVGVGLPGPFWHHRSNSKEAEGSKIEEGAKESFTSKGGPQTLTAKISGSSIELLANSTEGEEGKIYNNTRQGQIEFKNFYKELRLVKPELKACEVKIGKENKVPLKGHLMWKWNGENKQLEESPQPNQTPDIGFTAVEPRESKGEVNFTKDGTLTNLTFSGASCGILAGSFALAGSDVAIPNRKLEEWAKTLNIRTLKNPQSGELNEVYLQHYWNGIASEGIKLGLAFATEPVSLVGQTENEATEEVSIFEK
jgi:hypothetical protein